MKCILFKVDSEQRSVYAKHSYYSFVALQIAKPEVETGNRLIIKAISDAGNNSIGPGVTKIASAGPVRSMRSF